MFPVNPDVFERDPAGKFIFHLCPHDARKINRIFLQRTLQPSAPGGARVQVRGEWRQRFDARVGNSRAGKVCIIQSETQSRHAPGQAQGALRRG